MQSAVLAYLRALKHQFKTQVGICKYVIFIACPHQQLLQETPRCYVNYRYFFLNNQPDALIIQIYSVIKLYMFRAPSLPIIRSSLLYIRHW